MKKNNKHNKINKKFEHPDYLNQFISSSDDKNTFFDFLEEQRTKNILSKELNKPEYFEQFQAHQKDWKNFYTKYFLIPKIKQIIKPLSILLLTLSLMYVIIITTYNQNKIPQPTYLSNSHKIDENKTNLKSNSSINDKQKQIKNTENTIISPSKNIADISTPSPDKTNTVSYYSFKKTKNKHSSTSISSDNTDNYSTPQHNINAKNINTPKKTHNHTYLPNSSSSLLDIDKNENNKEEKSQFVNATNPSYLPKKQINFASTPKIQQNNSDNNTSNINTLNTFYNPLNILQAKWISPPNIDFLIINNTNNLYYPANNSHSNKWNIKISAGISWNTKYNPNINNFSPYTAISTDFPLYFFKIQTGIFYYQISNIQSQLLISQKLKYDFGFTQQSDYLHYNQIHFIGIPIRIAYPTKYGHISIGASIDYIAYTQVTFQTQIQQSLSDTQVNYIKDKNYITGLNQYIPSLLIRYEYPINTKWSLTSEFYHHLKNIQNTQFNFASPLHKSLGLRISIQYQLK
ncbi:MAG: hypothetical protein Fur0023_17990 [Bacteroidia bacterium]